MTPARVDYETEDGGEEERREERKEGRKEGRMRKEL